MENDPMSQDKADKIGERILHLLDLQMHMFKLYGEFLMSLEHKKGYNMTAHIIKFLDKYRSIVGDKVYVLSPERLDKYIDTLITEAKKVEGARIPSRDFLRRKYLHPGVYHRTNYQRRHPS